MRRIYFLDGKTPVPTADMRRVEKDIGHRVALTEIDGVRISTVFLGIDHNFFGGEPILFETMIFGGPHDGAQQRYSSWEEAENGHEEMVKLATGKQP